MNTLALISAQQLTRRFGRLVAVDDVGFELRRGEVLGFLGPNGAGKSTTMQMLTGNLAPTQGKVRINGIDLQDEPKRAKALIGYLPERPPLYRELTVDEYLNFCARLHRLARAHRAKAIEQAKARCGLDDVGHRLLGNLSKGYQQRAGIAQAILHTPEVVILDEPTVGLDPIQIRQIRDLIAELGADHGVILSTHILPEVQAICSRVQIIHQGRLVFSERMEALARRTVTGSLILGLARAPDVNALQRLPGVERIETLEAGRYRLHGERLDSERLAAEAQHAGWGVRELTPERQTLEQIFVQLTTTEEAAPESQVHAA